jgi:hypothetical protein
MKKTYRALALVSALAMGCGSSAPANTSSAPLAPGAATSAGPAAPIEVTVAEASARAVPEAIALTGTLLPDEDSRLAPVVPGRVIEVMVERGDHVEEGQPLVRLRDVDFRLQAASARAQLAQARARLGIAAGARPPAPEDTPEVRSAAAALSLAEESLRRAEELGQRGVLPPAQLDEARTRAAQARDQHATALQGTRGAIAALGAAEAQLSLASSALIAVARSGLRPAPGVHLGAHPRVGGGRRREHPRPRRRPLSQHRLPGRGGEHGAPWSLARAGRDGGHRQARGGHQLHLRPRRAALQLLRGPLGGGARFDLDKDTAVAAQEVRDRVNRTLSLLPRASSSRASSAPTPTPRPVMLAALSAPRTSRELTEYADRVLRRRIESLNGVGGVTVLGGRARQINVVLDPRACSPSGSPRRRAALARLAERGDPRRQRRPGRDAPSRCA